MFATTLRGVRVGCVGRLTCVFNDLKSTVSLFSDDPFLFTTTIGWHQSDGSVTGSMMPFETMPSNCTLTWSRYANGMDLAVCTRCGVASSSRTMSMGVPFIGLSVVSSKTSLNSARSSALISLILPTVGLALTLATCFGQSGGNNPSASKVGRESNASVRPS